MLFYFTYVVIVVVLFFYLFIIYLHFESQPGYDESFFVSLFSYYSWFPKSNNVVLLFFVLFFFFFFACDLNLNFTLWFTMITLKWKIFGFFFYSRTSNRNVTIFAVQQLFDDKIRTSQGLRDPKFNIVYSLEPALEMQV